MTDVTPRRSVPGPDVAHLGPDVTHLSPDVTHLWSLLERPGCGRVNQAGTLPMNERRGSTAADVTSERSVLEPDVACLKPDVTRLRSGLE